YGTLKGQEVMLLSAGPGQGWKIDKGAAGVLTPFAVAVGGTAGRAEGWSHIMDATRCTTLAVAGFGRETNDRIEIAANGRVRLSRVFGTGRQDSKSMTAWFHFVGNPVQVGAVTSPQAMQSPL